MSDKDVERVFTTNGKATMDLNFILPDYYIPTGEQVTQYLKEEIEDGAEQQGE